MLSRLISKGLTNLAESQNWRCCYCGIRCEGFEPDDDSPTREHIVAQLRSVRDKASPLWKTKNPVNIRDNMVMSCRKCNVERSATRLSALAFYHRKQRELSNGKSSKYHDTVSPADET
jgi:5-methylcytosine-specific restriction endonuclease McrA